jgi:DNA-binding response OmpR family regulator
MRVLIVEDSDSIVRMIEALIKARGFDVRSAGSGAKGVEEALAWKPHVVLLDINLPGAIDGIEVCRRLRAEKDSAEIPIIFISAMTDEEVKRRAHEAGASAYFEKPFSPLALLKEIESFQRKSGRFSPEA